MNKPEISIEINKQHKKKYKIYIKRYIKTTRMLR